jgi:hypothetical protein
MEVFGDLIRAMTSSLDLDAVLRGATNAAKDLCLADLASASCLGALREAIGSAVDGTIDRVVFDLPPEGIGEHLFPALQDLAHFCKPDG